MPVIRPARQEDIVTVARMHPAMLQLSVPGLPVVHTPEEDHVYFHEDVFARSKVWIVEDDGAVVGYCAFKPGFVEHLYVAKAYQGQGWGARLIKLAMVENETLRLWTFQKNEAAIAFYKAQGFKELRRTDGAGNDEKEPDVLLEWQRIQA